MTIYTLRHIVNLAAVNHHAVGMRINASKTKAMSALIPGEQRQAVLLNGEPLEGVDKFKLLQARAPRRSKAGLILPVPHSFACNPVFGRGVKYRCIERAGYTRQ